MGVRVCAYCVPGFGENWFEMHCRVCATVRATWGGRKAERQDHNCQRDRSGGKHASGQTHATGSQAGGKEGKTEKIHRHFSGGKKARHHTAVIISHGGVQADL